GDVTNSDTTRIAHRQLKFAALHVHIPFTGCHHRRCSIRDRRSLEPTLTLIHDHARRIYVLPRLRVKHRLAFTVTRDLALVNHPGFGLLTEPFKLRVIYEHARHDGITENALTRVLPGLPDRRNNSESVNLSSPDAAESLSVHERVASSIVIDCCRLPSAFFALRITASANTATTTGAGTTSFSIRSSIPGDSIVNVFHASSSHVFTVTASCPSRGRQRSSTSANCAGFNMTSPLRCGELLLLDQTETQQIVELVLTDTGRQLIARTIMQHTVTDSRLNQRPNNHVHVSLLRLLGLRGCLRRDTLISLNLGRFFDLGRVFLRH